MDTDVKTESSDKRLGNLVAVTVVILSVFMAVSKIKDDNINQAMQKAKSESVDAWAEYQAARVKLHVDENGLAQLRLLETAGNFDRALAAKQAAEYEADIKKYEGRSKETRAKAERLEKEYDQLGGRRGRPGRQCLAALYRLGLRRPRHELRNCGLSRVQFPARMAGATAGHLTPESGPGGFEPFSDAARPMVTRP